MDESTFAPNELALKIKRLVEERGWNQDEFARIANFNRHTARQIMRGGERTLRNATIGKCARALGVTVNELHTQPLEKLLARMAQGAAGLPSDLLRRTYDLATQPDLRAWLERNADRARQLSEDEMDELLAAQGDDGPLSAVGVETFVRRIERRRALYRQVDVIAGSEYLGLLEQLVALIHDKVRPPRDPLEPT
jgi:transcriptional regulator with XRE-family HTH domain